MLQIDEVDDGVMATSDSESDDDDDEDDDDAQEFVSASLRNCFSPSLNLLLHIGRKPSRVM